MSTTIFGAIEAAIDTAVMAKAREAVREAIDAADIESAVEEAVREKADGQVERAVDDFDFNDVIGRVMDDVDVSDYVDFEDLARDAVTDYVDSTQFERLLNERVAEAVRDMSAGGPSDEVVDLREQVAALTERLALIERWAASAANLIVNR